MFRRKLFVLSALVLFSGVVTFGVVGCDEKEAQAQRARVQALYDEAVAANDTEKAAVYADLLGKADTTIDKAKSDPVPTTAEEIVSSPLISYVPEPLRSPIVLGVGLFASIWRAIRWKNAAKSIAASIEKLPDTTKWDDPLTTVTLDANQTPAAKAAVDLAQGKSVSLIDRII